MQYYSATLDHFTNHELQIDMNWFRIIIQQLKLSSMLINFIIISFIKQRFTPFDFSNIRICCCLFYIIVN